jgi:glutaryl-CoA dehydrogenase
MRDAARAFAQEKPAARQPYLNEETDPGIFREFGELGVLGITVDETYGGLGGQLRLTYGLVAREVERVDSGYRSMMSVQSSLVMYPIDAYGSEAQRASICPSWRPASGSAASA